MTRLSLIFVLVLIKFIWGLEKIRLGKTGAFVDEQDRVVLFRGFNSVYKSPPWYDRNMLNRTQLVMFQKWGVNVIRLGMMWAGVMPNRGTVDQKYMETMENIIDLCNEYGIYVLLDMHQDTLSTRFGGYDGLPLWLVDRFPKPPKERQYPWPYSEPPGQWFENYLTYACMDCAEHLYLNTSGAWVDFGDFWETVAAKYGSKANVLGYEFINEPPMSNFYKRPWNALPGYVGKNQLLPMYDYLVERIRKVDPETLIFYEPLTYGVFLPSSFLNTGTGFDRVPGSLKDPQAAKKSVLSYHYYCWLLQTVDASKNMNWWQRFLCQTVLLPSVFKNSIESVRRSGGGRFLSEFGLCEPDGNPHSINTLECRAVLDKADELFESWTYWDTNFLSPDGNPIHHQVKSFVRTYPVATKGTPIKMSFSVESGEFHYLFLVETFGFNEHIKVAEIFVPFDVHYPKGIEIKIEPSSAKTELKGNLVEIYVPGNISEMPTTIYVRMFRKP
ncbi:unnamed protein product [Calicophoron daubneyi]|uniref:Endoglycoceramidase n=1 Tax=Calicophoron daubneyi TaxID=300641 RepID=A0AAV2T120_CALDB